jgi:hypothetical protein
MDTIKEVGDLGMKGKKIPDFYEQFIIDEHNQSKKSGILKNLLSSQIQIWKS